MSTNKSNKPPSTRQSHPGQEKAKDNLVNKPEKAYMDETYSDNSRLIRDENGFTLVESEITYKPKAGCELGIQPVSKKMS